MEFVEINLSSTILRRYQVERVGPTYLKTKQCHVDCDDEIEDTSRECSVGHVVDINYLKSLDPKEWKSQDHYAVLGLENERFNAADDDIRRAYRSMVLQHHPDKRKAKGEDVKQEDDYFTCITKAYEILGTAKTRRAYDSVDPQFDDAMPTQSEIDGDFYKVFNKYFDLNARWSEKKRVPSFGGDQAKREDVEQFYSFWYDFKSWREYSYMDEEDKEKGQDRDERRWIEKENKTARIKRKKEEMVRIRALVDLAYNNDKRIQRFKNEEKEKKLAAKRAKMDAAQAQKAEQERAVREAQLAKEKVDKAEQKRIELIRIEKEQVKKAVKRERKQLRDRAKEHNYFESNERDMLKSMEGVEKLCESYNLAELQELNKQMEAHGREAFIAALERVEQRMSAELQQQLNKLQRRPSASNGDLVAKELKKAEVWTNENVQLLIKAVNLFPAGTTQRWDVIASFLNQHAANGLNVHARDVLSKAKALQSSDFSKNALKTLANETPFESYSKAKRDIPTSNEISVNYNSTAVTAELLAVGQTNGNGPATAAAVVASAAPPSAPAEKVAKTAGACKTWTKEEQALLEQAIRTFPISTPDRWERIAECVPQRTKKECLRRVRDLVDLVNTKKEAQQAVK